MRSAMALWEREMSRERREPAVTMSEETRTVARAERRVMDGRYIVTETELCEVQLVVGLVVGKERVVIGTAVVEVRCEGVVGSAVWCNEVV